MMQLDHTQPTQEAEAPSPSPVPMDEYGSLRADLLLELLYDIHQPTVQTTTLATIAGTNETTPSSKFLIRVTS